MDNNRNAINDNSATINAGSGPNESFAKEDIMKLNANSSMPQLSQLPMPCDFLEIVQVEGDTNPFCVGFKIDFIFGASCLVVSSCMRMIKLTNTPL